SIMRLRGIASVVVALSFLSAPATHGDDQPDAKPILDKAIKAMGGEGKLAKLNIGTGKGKFSFQEGGQTFEATMDASWDGLGKYHADLDAQVNGMAIKAVLIINGDKAWARTMDRTEDFPKEAQPFVRNLLYALRSPQLLPTLRGKDFKLSPLGETKIDNKVGVGLLVNHKDHKDMSLYFDKNTGLPLKAEIRLKDAQGKEVTIEYHYSDYKTFDGLKQPAKVTIKFDNKEIVAEISELKAEEKLDDS